MAKVNFANPVEVELALESIEGCHIENIQNWIDFTPHQIVGYEATYRDQHPKIVERTVGCTDVYNCHGLVFASRRTKIYNPRVLRQLLKEDGYRSIPVANTLPGDVVLYSYAASAAVVGGDIFHSGIVVESPGLLPFPKVVSKWGPWVEVVHYANDCPYAREADSLIEYYRLDPPT